MALDFSGYKALAVNLLNQGKEADLRQALQLLGKLPADIDAFIIETQAEKVQLALSADRKAFTDNIDDSFTLALPEVEGTMIEELVKLTEDWTKMPTFTVSLQRMVEKDKDSGIETVMFTWAKVSKWSGVSTPKAQADGESNGTKAKGLKAPEPYATWQAYAEAIIPSKVQEYIAKHGGTTGLNARKLVGSAVKSGDIEIPAGYTIDQLM